MHGLMCVLALTATVTYPIAPPSTIGTTTIPEIIENTAERYGVDSAIMESIIWCESGMNPDAIGDHGTSYGLSQIHLPAHPGITKEQALDPEFAINFMAKEISQGNMWKWTCAKRFLSPTYPHPFDLHTIANAI